MPQSGGKRTEGTPVVLGASKKREALIKRLQHEEKALEKLGHEVLGDDCDVVAQCGAEIEFVAVLPKGVNTDTIPIPRAVRGDMFALSPFVIKVSREPRISGHTDTLMHKGKKRYGVQVEFITSHQTRQPYEWLPSREDIKTWLGSTEGEMWKIFHQRADISAPELAEILEVGKKGYKPLGKPKEDEIQKWKASDEGKSWRKKHNREPSGIELAGLLGVKDINAPRNVTLSETGRLLEILPLLAAHEAPREPYGLEGVSFAATPFMSDKDQTSGLQLNLSLADKKGHNLFADTNGRASPLMLCFLMELLESDKDAAAFFAPTPDSYKRFRQFAAPQNVGLGDRRRIGHFGSMLIRGKNYKAERTANDPVANDDPDIEKKLPDNGGVRLEHRLPCPEMLTISTDQYPYILMDYYLQHMKRALLRYGKLRDAGTLGTLNEKELFAALEAREKAREKKMDFTEDPLVKLYPLPKTWKQAVQQFKDSKRLQEVMGDNFGVVCGILDVQAQKSTRAAAMTMR